MHRYVFRYPLYFLMLLSSTDLCMGGEVKSMSGVRKLHDTVIYKDDRFYSAFPSIVRRGNGEVIVAFRRAPERRLFGANGSSHTDPNSYLVLVRSRDEGQHWSQTPELIYAHPFGGSQDPCMIQLQDGSILCSSYSWLSLQPEGAAKLKNVFLTGNFAFLGGFTVRSTDGGRTWQEPNIPQATPGEAFLDPFGKSLPAYNRGAMCQGKDGKLYWAVAATTSASAPRSEVHLLISTNNGKTWTYSCRIAADLKISFNETSLYETPKGALVAFLRTADFDDHTVVARSLDNGRTFLSWKDSGFKGHPHYALGLPYKRVLLVYGYRHQPFGIRGRVLDAECQDISSSQEIVFRDDGGNGDIGYPWAVNLSKNRVLVVYYFNQANGTRHIAGTILEIEKQPKK